MRTREEWIEDARRLCSGAVDSRRERPTVRHLFALLHALDEARGSAVPIPPPETQVVPVRARESRFPPCPKCAEPMFPSFSLRTLWCDGCGHVNDPEQTREAVERRESQGSGA